MGVVLFQREPIGTLWPELLPLAAAHWREVRWDTDSEANLDQAKLAAADDAGVYRLFTARQDGELIGYAAFWIAHHPQNAGSLEADADAVYLRPDRRRGRTGIDLLKFADDALQAMGVRTVYHHVRHNARDFGPVLQRLGYGPIETVHARKLSP